MASNPCPCKAELASILNSLALSWRVASQNRDKSDSAENAEDISFMLMGIADALSPPPSAPVPSPAPAETQEPCMVVEYSSVLYPFGIETSNHHRFWSWGANSWMEYFGDDKGRNEGNYKTRADAERDLPAARAALLAASEPGKPAPAPFDAGKLATEVARELQDNLLIWGQGRPTARLPDNATCRIMDALTAAHEAGKASPSAIKSPEGEWDSIADLLSDYAAYRRALEAASLERIEAGKAEAAKAPLGCVINHEGESLVAEPVNAAPYPFNPRRYQTEWLWRLTKQPPAPPAEKEGTR